MNDKLRNKVVFFAFALSLGITTLSCGCDKDPEITQPDGGEKETEKNKTPINGFVMGADLSYVNQVLNHGGIYKDSGTVENPYKIFSQHGANLVRLRLWHNPIWVKGIYGNETTIYSAYADIENSIKQSKENGMSVNLDFHYSDIWADPLHQDAPAAWANITDITVLCDSVYNYTYDILYRLHQKNILPEMVQIGNEINTGIMCTNTANNFPKLSISKGDWGNVGKVLNAGIKAVRDIDSLAKTKTLIAIHVADPKNLDWWTGDMINKAGVTDFDIIGFSYYPIWHTKISFSQLPQTVKSVKSKYNKQVMILETAYPFSTGGNDSYNNLFGSQTPLPNYPFTVVGQKNFMIDLTQSMIDAGASGVMYWEPAWITSQMSDLWGTGSSWENCTFFDFSGNTTDAINYMQHEYTVQE